MREKPNVDFDFIGNWVDPRVQVKYFLSEKVLDQ
jgi:hypothetical protein